MVMKRRLKRVRQQKKLRNPLVQGYEKAVAGKFNQQLVDLTRPLEEDGAIEIITPGSDEALEVLRHSTAHLMAQALKRLYGDVHFGVGPVIDGGFYYDFDMEEKVSSDDFEKIEKTMKQIIEENHKVERQVVSRDEAKAFLQTIHINWN